MAKTNKDELTKAGFAELVERQIATPQDIEREHQVTLSNALDEEGKKRIALDRIPFFIKDVAMLEGQFSNADNPNGFYWRLDIVTPTGEKILFMNWHQASDPYFTALHKTVVQQGKVAGPYRLEYIERHDKPSFFKLEASELTPNAKQETMAF